MTLTDDERIVLEIAASGAPMMPLGIWAAAVRSLAAKGYLRDLDYGPDVGAATRDLNYIITPEGMAAWQAWDKAETEEFKGAINRARGLE